MVKNKKQNLIKTDDRKLKKLVKGKNFDLTIMACILMNAIVLGMTTSPVLSLQLQPLLFVLDRFFMALFVLEMLLKIYVFRTEFFKSGWNVFDFVIVAISSFPTTNAFIVLRTFRLFRLLKYIDKFSGLKGVINTFLHIIPAFLSMMAVSAVFFYVYAIIGFYLFGAYFVDFASLGDAMLTLLRVYTFEGWSSDVVRSIMIMFSYGWLYFVSFMMFSFLILVSFVVSAVGQKNK